MEDTPREVEIEIEEEVEIEEEIEVDSDEEEEEKEKEKEKEEKQYDEEEEKEEQYEEEQQNEEEEKEEIEEEKEQKKSNKDNESNDEYEYDEDNKYNEDKEDKEDNEYNEDNQYNEDNEYNDDNQYNEDNQYSEEREDNYDNEDKEDNNDNEDKEDNKDNEKNNSRNNIQENISSTNITSGEGYNNYEEISNYNNNYIENRNAQTNEELKDFSTSNDNTNENSTDKKNKVRSAEKNHYIEELINIINNEEIIDLIDDKKWENRKKGFTKLNEYIIEHKLNKKYFDVFFMYIYIKLNNFKESNFNLIKEGIKCLLSLFNQIKNNNYDDLNNKISDKKYIKILLTDLFEKIADNKIKDIYLDLLDVLSSNYSNKEILEILFDRLKNTNKVNILKEYAIYFKYLLEVKQILSINNYENINVVNLIDFTIKLSNNSNPQIRKLSINLLCLLYKYIGEDLKLFLKNIKNESTLKMIEKEISKINIDNNTLNKNIILNNSSNKKGGMSKGQFQTVNIKRVDISKDIPVQLLKDIDKGKWNDKKEGIDFLHKLLDKSNNNISINGLDNLFMLIKEKLKDGNKNLVKAIIELLSHLIDAVGPQIKKYSKNNIILSLLSNLSEKNQQVRDECIKCVQKWTKCESFEIFCYHFPKLLNNDNYEMRYSILDLLLKNCGLITRQYNKSFFNELIKALLICLQDKNSEIRKKTEEFMKKFELVKKEDYYKEAKDFKPAIAEYLINNLKMIFADYLSFPSFYSTKNDSGLLIKKVLDKNMKTFRQSGENLHSMNRSLELVTDRKKKTKKSNKKIRHDSCPNVLNNINNNNNNNEEKNDNTKKGNNNKKDNNTLIINKTSLNKKIKRKIKINNEINNKKEQITTINNKKSKELNLLKTPIKNIKLKENPTNNNLFRTLVKDENHKSFDNINKVKNDTTVNNNDLTVKKNMEKNNSINLRNKVKSKKNNYIRLNLNTNNLNKKDSKIINFVNRSAILTREHNKLSNNKINNTYSIFLPNYKIKNGEKEKRYELDIKNNFLFEIQNFDYMKKLKESTKKIFSKEFHKKIFSLELSDIISCIYQFKNILEQKDNNNDNNDTFQKLMNNIDIILKKLGYDLSTNQASSLIKNFFEFSELLIEYYKNEKITINEIDSNILLNIFCDKLLTNNEQLVNNSNNLIFKLTEIIGDNKSFVMLINLIKYKIVKLRYKIIDIIIKIYSNSKIDNNTLSKTLINIINLWFDSDHNIKNKIKSMIQKIYISLGKYEFISLTKFFTDKQKDEVFLNILEENEDYFQENCLIETEKKGIIRRSKSVRHREINNLNKEIKPIKIEFNNKEDKNIPLKRSGLSTDKFDKNKKNDITQEREKEKGKGKEKEKEKEKKKRFNNSISSREVKNDKNYFTLKDKSLLSLNNKNTYKNSNPKNEKNMKVKVNRIGHLNMKSQILNNKKILDKIKTNNNQLGSNNYKLNPNNKKTNKSIDIKININDNKINLSDNKPTNNISSEKLNIILLSLYESALKDNSKAKIQLINRIHDIVYNHFSKNKKIIINNSNNIIATFINTTKKYIQIISKEITSLKNLTKSFSLICTIKEILYNLSYDVEYNLIELIFYVLSLKDLTIMGKNEEGMSIWKNYNLIMIRTVDYCNPLHTIKILFYKIITNKINNPKNIEYCSRCLSILVNNMKDISDKINVAHFLFIINSFLLEYNKNQSKQIINNNKIFQTIKELIYQLVEVRKDKIFEDYNNYMNIKSKNNEDVLHDKNIKIWINDVIRNLDSDYLIK